MVTCLKPFLLVSAEVMWNKRTSDERNSIVYIDVLIEVGFEAIRLDNEICTIFFFIFKKWAIAMPARSTQLRYTAANGGLH